MRWIAFVSSALFAAMSGASASAQMRQSDEEFAKSKPGIGDMLPDVTVYAPDGKEVKTSELRGHYTVLTFGCLT